MQSSLSHAVVHPSGQAVAAGDGRQSDEAHVQQRPAGQVSPHLARTAVGSESERTRRVKR